MFGIRCYARIQKGFLSHNRTYTALRVAIYHHLYGLFGLLKAFEVERPKTQPWPKLQKFLHCSHCFDTRFVLSKTCTQYLERNLVRKGTYPYVSSSRFNCHNVGCEAEGHHNSDDGPEQRTYTKSLSFVEDCHLSSTIYFHDKNGRRSICSDWASFIQRPAGSNAPLYYISTKLYGSLWFELCAMVNPKRANFVWAT